MVAPSYVNLPPLRETGDPFDESMSYSLATGSFPFKLKCNQALLNHLAKPRAPFPYRASKEVDSGIVAHETPDNAPVPSPPSSPASVASAPASLGVDISSSEIDITTAGSRREQDGEETHVAAPKIHRFGAFLVELNPAKLPYLRELFKWSQGGLPADACLFVGNLPASFTNYAMTVQLHEMFSHYGTCYVRVGRRHNSPQKPYALVQFQSFQVAEAARSHSFQQPLLLGGRELRVLPSTARRSIRIAPRPGSSHDVRLAINKLAQFVPVASAWWVGGGPVVEVRFHHHGDYVWGWYLVNNGYLGGNYIMF